MERTERQEIKARPDQIQALDRYRRGQKVTLDAVAQRFHRGTSWLSRALKGYLPLSRGDIQELRQIVEDIAKEREQTPAKQ